MTDTKISALPELLTPSTGDVLPITHLGTTYKIQEQNLVPAQVNADWNAVSGVAQILNKPQLAQSITNALHKWLNSYNATTGLFTQTQPDYSDLTNLPQLAQTSAAAANKFLTAYDATTGLFTNAQPDWSNLSGIPSTFPIATPGTLTVSSTNNAAGAHTHAITSSSNPGAAASLLATASNGSLTLQTTSLSDLLLLTSSPTFAVSNSTSLSALNVFMNPGVDTGISNSGNQYAIKSIARAAGSGTGTIGTISGGYFLGEAGGLFSGTVSTAYGIYVSSGRVGGTVTTAYSVYIDGPNGTVGTKYAIYQETTGVNNYFASATNFNAGLNIAGGTVYTAISTNPGAAAAILATDANGNVAVQSVSTGSTATKWGSGTAFPGTPTTNDRFFRTDLGFFCYYDGTRWLSAHESVSILYLGDTAAAGVSQSVRVRSDYAPYFTRVAVSNYLAGTNNGTNYWTVTFQSMTKAFATPVTIYSYNTSGDTGGGVWTDHEGAPSTANPSSYGGMNISLSITGAPGHIQMNYITVYYRLIVT